MADVMHLSGVLVCRLRMFAILFTLFGLYLCGIGESANKSEKVDDTFIALELAF